VTIQPYHTQIELAASLAETRESLRPSAKRFDRVAFAQLFGLPPSILSARKRKPSLARTIKQAEKAAGKPVTSVTLPDGTKLVFGEPEPTEETNPLALDADVESWLSRQPRKN
jgi:hypothetical protein